MNLEQGLGGGGGARDPPAAAAAAAAASDKDRTDATANFRLLCKGCDLEWAGKDSATQDLIKSSSKPCPFCEMPTTHYRGHACHHIRGCLNCKQHWCYMCSAKSRSKNSWAPSCTCANNGFCYCDLVCVRRGCCDVRSSFCGQCDDKCPGLLLSRLVVWFDRLVSFA